jgi:hypothetical protein
MRRRVDCGWSRRQWLRAAGTGLAATSLAGCDASKPAPVKRHFKNVPGEIVGQPVDDAHKLRDFAVSSTGSIPLTEPVIDCIVIGSGVAGGTTAWKLRRAGVDDVVLLELDDRVGGTSAWSEDATTAYPWAAHYVTTPPAWADCLIEVLTDLGVLVGVRDEDGWPIGNPAYVVRHPAERLQIGGRWTGDILTSRSTDRAEQHAMKQMADTLFAYMQQRSVTGRPAFTVPVAYSAADESLMQLDRITMGAWMREHGFVGERLEWNVDYACRDDYGATRETVSAWAGIHYHACRFHDDRYRYQYPVETFTWPEGNGFLIRGLLRDTPPERVRTGHMVTAIEPSDEHVDLVVYDRRTHKLGRMRCRHCVFAGKLHVLGHILKTLSPQRLAALDRCRYAPWLVAQVHVKRLPASDGRKTAWDNVRYESASLGYVVANHQTRWSAGAAREADQPTVLTFYHPFSADADAARAEMLTRDHAWWADLVLNDLTAMHPEIESLVTRVDVMLYGHAMVVPVPGYIWAEDRALRSAPIGRVHLAGADASGLALYEEAVFHGLRAAEEVLDGLGRTFSTSLANWNRS